MEWTKKKFISPMMGRALNVLIDDDGKKYFTLNSLLSSLGYSSGAASSGAMGKVSYIDPDFVMALGVPMTSVRGLGNKEKVYIIDKDFALELLRRNNFYKPQARRNAPKLLNWIKTEVLPSCERKCYDNWGELENQSQLTEIYQLLQDGISFFNKAPAKLRQLAQDI